MSIIPIAVVSLMAAATAVDADRLQVLPESLDGVPPSEMMHAYLMGRVYEALDRRDAEYEKIKTPEQIAAYQQRMREFFVSQLGGFPKRTPLNPSITGRKQCDGYRIEKIIFESQPGHFVTAVLYLPLTEPPYPGVLVPCGHSRNGKAAETYQRVCILMARNGLAALCYDPICQGERHQLLDPEGDPIDVGTEGHDMVGVGSILLGRSAATFRVWDGMRGIDYLQSRPEIDAQRIGCTGNSGGGCLTSYLMALDQRIDCAAPSCYLTSLRRLMETLGPADAEQNIHAQIAHGMGHTDYVLMRAPKPTLICTATRDFMDISGSWINFRQSKRFYTRLGHAERVDLIEADASHGFSTQLRVGATRWMRRWLLGVDDAVGEPEFPVLSDEECLCTPQGEVMLFPGSRSTFDLNDELEAKLAATRRQFWQQTDRQAALDEVRRITGIRRAEDLPKLEWVKTGTVRRTGYLIEKLILQPEEGIWLPALAFVPHEARQDAYLYVHANGKQTDAASGGSIEKLVQEGYLVLAVDVRGTGETANRSPRQRHTGPYVGALLDDVNIAYELGTSYLAMRAEDVVVCSRFLAGYRSPDGPRRMHLVGIGDVGPAVLHAAALEPQLFASVALRKCLLSWSDVVAVRPPDNALLINVVHGALRRYDLSDLLASIPPKRRAQEKSPVLCSRTKQQACSRPGMGLALASFAGPAKAQPPETPRTRVASAASADSSSHSAVPLRAAQRVADHYIADCAPRLNYADLLTLYGLARLAEVAERKDYDAFVDRTLSRFIQQGQAGPLSFENYSMGGLAGALRCVQGRFPGDPELLRKYADQLVRKHARDQAGVFCHPRLPGEKIWVDCLMAVCPFLSMAAVVLDDESLHEESISQYLGMEKALLDPSLGLFHQVQNFGPAGCRSTDTWGRGNGWALIGLAELIRYLPENHPRREAMIARLRSLLSALKPLQAESGMWRQNLVTPDSYEETSATGLILYALAMGTRRGWLPDSFEPMATRAWRGLAKQVDSQGAVHGTCIGTRGNCDSTLEFYLQRPTRTDDIHSFGPVLLAAVEMHMLNLAEGNTGERH